MVGETSKGEQSLITYSEYYAKQVKEGKPGSLWLLFDAVMNELNDGLTPDRETLITLLSNIKLARYSDSVEEQLEALCYIEMLREFDDIENNRPAAKSFREAVKQYIEIIKNKKPANRFESEVHAYEIDNNTIDGLCKRLSNIKNRNK